MLRLGWWAALPFLCVSCSFGEPSENGLMLKLPQAGDHELTVVTPIVLELSLVTERRTPESSLGPWDFVDATGKIRLPKTSEFLVTSGEETIPVKQVGFRRRVLYAPLKQRDLRIGNYLYVELARSVREGAPVKVENPGNKLWPGKFRFESSADPQRFSPVLHVNQTGYSPRYPCIAMVGYFLGSMGELRHEQIGTRKFRLLEAGSGREVFAGELSPRRDRGFPYPEYQQVLQADFSSFKSPGRYRLSVDGLGVSFPFVIHEHIHGAFARTYALGIYHQRCGAPNSFPFTRFTHGPCHTGLVEVPTMSKRYEAVNFVLNQESANARNEPRHKAQQLKNVDACLYPMVNKGPLRIAGGHHDAGDYSKYTINSASFIHHLMVAVDSFEGVAALDNLGLPESGDRKSDVLQLAKWEADFLAQMQDADGGFYFLVYPRERRYENNVLPDAGDPQVVFPKTTSVTAAATAALAQCASSPAMKEQFPESAALYKERAKKGWEFLERALQRHGKDGAYQKITHYGDEFMHDDELAWAACEMFLLTADSKHHDRVRQWLRPTDPGTRKWGWWRLYDAYGCAIRSYALAEKAGKAAKTDLDQDLARQCEDELLEAAQEQVKRSQQSAYGTSFPDETKRARSAGWYFSADAAFDLAVASQLNHPEKRDPREEFLTAIISNLNYEQGCNPVNVTYLTGLGFKRQREIVHQYAQNDHRILPPSGIPLGNVQGGFGWLDLYKKEPGALSFPPDDSGANVYPFYDRWSDAFNLTQEFVILHQARGLAYTAWLMAKTVLRTQEWRAVAGELRRTNNPSARHEQIFTLEAPGVDLGEALITWEGEGLAPAITEKLILPKLPKWLEAEALLPDGRRIFGTLKSPRSS